MQDVIVIGGGLFGCIITRKLRLMGLSVDLLDSPRKGAGSIPAACLMKPSWFSGLGQTVSTPSLQLLDDLYGLQDIRFRVGPVHTMVHWVQPSHVLSEPRREADVERVDLGGRVWLRGQETPLEARLVVVAAGVWSNELLPPEARVEGLAGRAGMAFLWPGQIQEPFISPWAPYRQLVAFNRDPGHIWTGDGSAIIPKNWGVENQIKSEDRCASAIGRRDHDPAQRLYGIRPYFSGKGPCAITSHGDRLWVATGGAKNGTIAAAWCAHLISTRL